ncbi:MAG: MFS transporter [Synergistaceae bacterium]|nr:MFS transporter [Synergistaceae bacterium]
MRWIGWVLLCGCFHMAYVLRLSAGVLREPLSAEFTLSASSFGLMSSMVFYAYTLLQIPSGVLADTRGVRSTVAGGMALAGAGALLFASAKSVPALFFGRALMGVGVAGIFVCVMKFLAENFERERFATLSGATSFAGNAGGIVAQAPLAMLVGALAWRGAFLSLGAVCLALAVLSALFLPAGRRSDVSQAELRAGVRAILRTRGMYFSGLNYLANQSCFLALSGTWGVSYLRAVHGIDQAPSYITLMVVGVMAGAVVAGRISDGARSRRRPLRLFAAAHALCWGALLLSGSGISLYALAGTLFSLGFFAGALVLPWSMAKEMNPPEFTGVAIALLNTAAFLAVAVLTSLMGVALDAAAGLSAEGAWRAALLLPFGVSVLGLWGAFASPETFPDA